ncbi:Golgi-specific brefeldin A-resistance guanine nucleotide exchange factor 1 [Fasciola gigantica]|uniref:Golgi-specific brefeldin A-resistance guanine nucleotide exchange factor 1 n=1 Tax=Fasciola gigantica TaxID=46835 RepID=A0A504YRJ8_FASGI|nr:Golgi-specific brefeldin A-resistance guanine nucleotide exchange factor 1 [Fasciola gigantica]
MGSESSLTQTRNKSPQFRQVRLRTTEVTTSPASPRRAVRSTAKSPTQHSGTLHHHVHSDSDSDLDVDPHGRGAYRAQKSSWTREILLSPTTGVIAVQLLDLIHLLLTRATSIYTEWKYTGATCGSDFEAGTSDEPLNDEKQAAESVTVDANYLWPNCWRPLLQAIARLCCDCRREVRTDALSYLHRVLLSSVLHPLSGPQWEECFEQVLFPLLSGFLESIAMEEAAAVADNTRSPKAGRPRQASSIPYHAVEYADPRMRAIPLLTKVFLQHLRPLHKSENFHTLWTRMLVYMEQYMQASSSDSLTDAVRESLKNVLLVMYTGTHDTPPILMRDAPPNAPEAVLWDLTAKQLSSFLPELLDQLFPPPPVPTSAPAAAPLPFTSEFTPCPTLESTPVPTSHEQVSPHTTPAPSLVSQCAETAMHSVLGHELPDHDSALPLPANAPFVDPGNSIHLVVISQ